MHASWCFFIFHLPRHFFCFKHPSFHKIFHCTIDIYLFLFFHVINLNNPTLFSFKSSFYFTFKFTNNWINSDARFTCKYGPYQKEWLFLFSFYKFATVMTFRFLFLYIGVYILTKLISFVWPIIFSSNYSSYPLFTETMESVRTQQAILSGKMLGGFVTMFLKHQVFSLFIHIPFYFWFVFLYSNLPYFEGFWVRRPSLHNT